MRADSTDSPPEEALAVLRFWFGTLKREQWWKRDEALDAEIVSRFGTLYEKLAQGVPETWCASPRGRLAAVIVLDQFPRNMFRGDPRAYATDAKALELAQDTINAGLDAKLDEILRQFIYMPLQHSEDKTVQAQSVELFKSLGDAEQIDYAVKHKEIVDRFGRFPHRNAVLGRKSTAEEKEFLKQPGLFW